jgi:hypothetical protein
VAGKARNSVMVQARRKTEELAAKRRERENILQGLATDYHAAKMMADQMVEDAEREAAELIAKAKRDAEAAGEDAKATVRKMLDTGETRQGIAELLDVSVSYVRGIDVATAKKPAAAPDADSSEEGGGVGVVPGHQGSDH